VTCKCFVIGNELSGLGLSVLSDVWA